MQKFIITENDANQRVDKFLTKTFPSLPQSLMYKAFRKKDIKINRKKCEISTRLQTGDVLEVYLNDDVLEKKEIKKDITKIMPVLNILYEDDNIILVDKKPGISVHDDETSDGETLIDMIQAYLYLKGEYIPEEENSFTPSLCNRIDKNTGGIVIAAKNAMALRTMNEKIKNREIDKKYLCIVHGKPWPREDTLNAYHIKNSKENRAYIFDEPQEGARKISTKYKVLKSKNGLSLLEQPLFFAYFQGFFSLFINKLSRHGAVPMAAFSLFPLCKRGFMHPLFEKRFINEKHKKVPWTYCKFTVFQCLLEKYTFLW